MGGGTIGRELSRLAKGKVEERSCDYRTTSYLAPLPPTHDVHIGGDVCASGYIIIIIRIILRGVTWTFNFHGIEAGKLSGNHLINFSKYRISWPEN